MRAYWNQMGSEVYGSIENALRQMLDDGGVETQRSLRKELMRISEGDDYRNWYAAARTDVSTIRQIGGAFILPEKIPDLLTVLEGWSNTKPS